MACRRQGIGKRANDQRPHAAGIAKANLRLGGMNVDVDVGRRDVEKQRKKRRAPARDEIAVSGANGADQELVLHRTAVDEQELLRAIGPVKRREASETEDAHRGRRTIAGARDFKRVVHELAAHDGADPFEPSGRRTVALREDGRFLLARLQREADVGMRHRQPPDDIGDGHGLGALGLQKLETRRRRGKEIAYLDDRSVIDGGRTYGCLGSAHDDDG